MSKMNYLRNNFVNWDEILKRAIDGKSTKTLLLKNGLTIKGLDNNALGIYKEVFHDRVYSYSNIMIEEGDVVFDVGANVGVFSLFAATVKDTKVFSFEPHPTNFKVLSENIKINKLVNITPFQVGLAKQNEFRDLIIGEIPGGHKVANGNETEKHKNILTIETRKIESIMLDEDIEKIDFLKLDCEGAEGEILSSISSDLYKKINKIVIEFHDNHSVLDHKEIIKLLEGENFKTNIKWDEKSFFGYIYAKK
jgi:FkbM family methyltransferase